MKGKGQLVRAAGAMSGTSLDGVDLAVIETDGIEIHGFGETGYRRYSEAERAVLRAALGRWPGEAGVAEAARVVEDAHIAISDHLADIAVYGFHGQTLAHDPAGQRTHQAGDGARVAAELGVPVVWDFRSADIGLGGQGAPLAPFYHWACARWAGLSAPVAFLNLGGVGNLTWVDPASPAPEAPGALLAFDTGPANAPMDDLVSARGLGAFDKDGALAARGTPDPAALGTFAAHPYLRQPAPKSLDRDAFPELARAVAALPTQDALATLAECVVGAVGVGLACLPSLPRTIYVTGGGRKNAHLMGLLTRGLPCAVAPVEEIGLSGDLLEAQAFAYLAVRVLNGLPTSAPGTTGVAAPVGGGVVSRP